MFSSTSISDDDLLISVGPIGLVDFMTHNTPYAS
jgi:hypothetical protein